MSKALPQNVQVAIVGGGIVGCAIAYHLAKAGWSVALFERKKLTSGTTWHAAGLVSETQAVPVMSVLAKYGLDLMEQLEDETGQTTGFKRNGSMTLALTEARMLGIPDLFWDPLIKAATLGQLGRLDEARDCLDRLLHLRPDFPQRSQEYVGIFITSDPLRDRILAGLQLAGLQPTA